MVFGNGNTWQAMIGASVLHDAQTAASINLMATLGKLVPLLLFIVLAVLVYLLVTLSSLGVMPRAELAQMRNLSMAGLITRLMGNWESGPWAA